MAISKKKRKAPLIDDYHLLSYEEVDSTNEEARRLAEGGGAHGAFIWSHRQTAGRGRQGRDWISTDSNLFVSVLLEPQCQLPRIPQLSFVAAVAAVESLLPLLPEPGLLRCKWPNDIMLDGKKLGGLLLESFETAEEKERTRWAVVGLGLNVDSAPDADELLYPVTYLKEAGVELISAKIVLSRFIHHFIECYGLWQKKGFPAIRDMWMDYCEGVGKQVEVSLPDQTITGAFRGLDGKGNLLIAVDNGEEQTIAAGDVRFL